MDTQRILIVEDNKALAKLIAKKLSLSLKMEIDTAYSLAEAKLFLTRYEYFVTVLDVNLPDAPNGEVIDYALKKENRVLVLSANIDKDFRKKMLEKNIIDYVNKSGTHDIDYIISTIKRLTQNQKHKILVVDDSMMFRKQMKTMLENLFFNVITVAHGEEAMGILQAQPDISLVLTDYNMPVMNGLELIQEIRKDYSKNELCIVALSGNEDDEINALFLKNGANDYIKKPFSKEEFSCRVSNSIEALENIQEITRFANRDHLTGLYNRRHLYNIIDETLNLMNEHEEQAVFAMIGIDDLQAINNTYGFAIGDKIVIALADILRSSVNASDLVIRFSGEDFCVFLKNVTTESSMEVFERFRSEIQNFKLAITKESSLEFSISLGVTTYKMEDSLEENLNTVDMLLYKAKQAGKNQLIFE